VGKNQREGSGMGVQVCVCVCVCVCMCGWVGFGKQGGTCKYFSMWHTPLAGGVVGECASGG